MVPADAVSMVPDRLALTVAAALLADGATALRLVEVTKLAGGDAVVVVGASGGLGVLLVQLAPAHAETVVAVARGAKLDRLRRLEPDAVVDSEQPD